ncbi:hypothetical protein [Burkholderia sp. KJ006]|uniref:hypothetical protein n=1 Tax=Burkholderia sp. KJ006 TaxID=416344 RepID=UPI0011D23FC0|nr:hypothetical protein [Burkholderia sp. KJ006]
MSTIRGDHQDELAEQARQLTNILQTLKQQLSSQYRQMAQEITAIEKLKLVDHSSMRQEALKTQLAALQWSQRNLNDVRREGSWYGLRTPLLLAKALKTANRARKDLQLADEAFEASQTRHARDEAITRHNDQVRNALARLDGCRKARDAYENLAKLVEKFHTEATAAIDAATGSGWISKDFETRFRLIVKLIREGKISHGKSELPLLRFQVKPSDTIYEAWRDEAVTLRSVAYETYLGMSATGAYGDIVQKSINLARTSLRNSAAQTLRSDDHTADQWQHLSSLVTDPRNFTTDALWAIYWSMFQCSQWATRALSESRPHEDIFTGKFSAQIERYLADFGAKRLAKFGYPSARSYIGTWEIASTRSETALGADIGVVIDIDIGPLQCRKVALLQAKYATNGRANIGSETGQLPRLASQPSKGFYLFYHCSEGPIHSPAPTVCSALELRDHIRSMGKSPDAASLSIGIRELGYDWASFVTFGLCQPQSALGVSFEAAEDALVTLSDGHPDHLPQYLYVIALSDDSRVEVLREKIHERYREVALVKQKGYNQRNEKTIDRGGQQR